MTITLRRLDAGDSDLGEIASKLNAPEWGGSIGGFSAASLEAFLADEHRLYVLAHVDGTLAGAAHAYVLFHPSGPVHLYIDEVDTLPAYRRMGVATALMEELFRLGRAAGAKESWLGADEGNTPAFALYRGLDPSEEEPGIIFTYRLSP